MAFKHSISIKQVDRDEYHAIDYVVMGLVYDIHNEFGRLNDEAIYQHELIRRCRKHGFDIKTEVQVVACYKGFKKYYYMDMVINDAIVYELKTVNTFVPYHRSQVLNYLLMTNLKYGKLINFRTSSVVSEYITTELSRSDRFSYTVNNKDCKFDTSESIAFVDICMALVNEFGVFIDVSLLTDAAIFFLSEDNNVAELIDVMSDETVIGRQKVNLLANDTAFEITTFTKGVVSYKKHLQKFISHTKLRYIQWININRHDISFVTIEQ